MWHVFCGGTQPLVLQEFQQPILWSLSWPEIQLPGHGSNIGSTRCASVLRNLPRDDRKTASYILLSKRLADIKILLAFFSEGIHILYVQHVYIYIDAYIYRCMHVLCVCVSKFGHQLSQPWLDVSQTRTVNNGIFSTTGIPQLVIFEPSTLGVPLSNCSMWHRSLQAKSPRWPWQRVSSHVARHWVLDGRSTPPNITASNERQISLHLMKYIASLNIAFFWKKMHGIILCRVKLKPKKHYNVENRVYSWIFFHNPLNVTLSERAWYGVPRYGDICKFWDGVNSD